MADVFICHFFIILQYNSQPLRKIITLLCFLILLISCHKKEVNTKQSGEDNESYAKARECRDSGNKDSAFIYYNLAKTEYQKKSDSIGTAQAMINMAIIQTDLGDSYGGIETSLEADHYLKNLKNPKARDNLPRNYNNIALASSRISRFSDAIKYYEKAIPYISKDQLPTIYNNLADSYIGLGEYDKAIKILNQTDEQSDSLNLARIINNLAIARFGNDATYNPVPEYHQALKIRNKLNDQTSLNSSYATLSDYYFSVNKDSALYYAEKMLQTANYINNPDDQLQALRKLVNLDKNNSHNYFKRFIKINDSVNTYRFSATNNFALIKSDMAETEAKNAELALENNENKNQKIYSIAAIVGLSIFLLFVILYFNKKRKIQQQEKQLEVRKTELKYSKKVHDVVANGIYQVMTKLENHQEISRNETLDDLEDVYRKSRNISYDSTSENTEEEFSDKIRKLVSYFKNEKTDTYLAGNDPAIWSQIPLPVRSETEQILRELLVNMKKHSHADRVILIFKRNLNSLEISYSDNGIGIKEKSFFKNGLQNVVSRIENLNGDITFDTETETGLKITFSVPVS